MKNKEYLKISRKGKDKLAEIKEDFFLNLSAFFIGIIVFHIMGFFLRGFDYFVSIVGLFFLFLMFMIAWLIKRAEEKELREQEAISLQIDAVFLEIEAEKILRICN